MLDILSKIFEFYQYQKIYDKNINDENKVLFYKHNDAQVANYFLVYSLDCRDIENDERKIKESLDSLEELYTGKTDAIPLKKQILELFENTQEAAQIDKNTSAIYLMKFNNIKKLNEYRNLIYSIEESPNYFKRYILPYTDIQSQKVEDSLEKNKEKPINEILSQIIDDEDSYYQLAEQKDLDNSYGLVIRMFSKIPFLKYSFKADIAPEPIDKMIESKLTPKQLKLEHFLLDDEFEIVDILELADQIDEKELEDEMNKIIEGIGK